MADGEKRALYLHIVKLPEPNAPEYKNVWDWESSGKNEKYEWHERLKTDLPEAVSWFLFNFYILNQHCRDRPWGVWTLCSLAGFGNEP